MEDTILKDRSSLDKRYLWNAESVFPDRAAWRIELEAVKAAMPSISAHKGSLASGGAGGLALLLETALGLLDRAGKLYVYAIMSQAVDSADAEALGMKSQATGLLGQYLAAAAFIEPELLALGQAGVEAWISAESRLRIYGHFAENLFRKQKHVRSAEVEEVLGQVFELFQSADTIREMLVDADLKFAPACDGSEVAQGSIEKLVTSPDRELRRSAWKSYCDAHIAHENGLAASLVTAVKRDAFNARVRRFPSSLEAALFEHDIPRSVFDGTIETFKRKLPIWHRYWRARRAALGVDRLEHCDIWAPIAKREPRVSYEEGVEWIADSLLPLGPAYSETLRRGCLEEGWVDVYPTVGKSSGAFSAGWKGTPPFVKMQYTDDLSSLSTLAHELGHSMHSWHTGQRQPTIYADYSIFVAEVASNFNQAMVRAHLFETQKDPEFQIALIQEAMNNFHRYFFIMPTLARFELELHERIEKGRGVGAEDMNALMADLFEEGYGGELEIDRRREGSTWAQFGHLYMNFYVFQYATGISAAHALALPILGGDSVAADRYLEFLSAGSSDYPVNVLARAGADMREPEAMEKCFEVLEGLVERLERLTKGEARP